MMLLNDVLVGKCCRAECLEMGVPVPSGRYVQPWDPSSDFSRSDSSLSHDMRIVFLPSNSSILLNSQNHSESQEISFSRIHTLMYFINCFRLSKIAFQVQMSFFQYFKAHEPNYKLTYYMLPCNVST